MKRACNLVSPFINNNSVAKVGRNLLNSLNNMNANFAVVDLSDEFGNIPLKNDIKFLKILNKSMVAELSVEKNIVFNGNLGIIRKYSFPYEYIPYFSIWTRGVPREHLDVLVDRKVIFVYNNFTKKSLCAQGINEDSIRVIPPSINTSSYKNPNKCVINGKKSFAFLSIVDVNDPNWMSVVRAFYNSFSFKDDVCLVLKASDREYSHYHRLNIARWIDSEKKLRGETPTVILMSDSFLDSEMASIYSSCDCYVKISGVNSGLSFIEAFASGLLCIGPENGGGREILDRNTGFVISKKTEKRISNDTILDGITYDVYDEDHLSKVMRFVFDNSYTLKEKTIKERKIVLSKFDQNIVGLEFLKSLR